MNGFFQNNCYCAAQKEHLGADEMDFAPLPVIEAQTYELLCRTFDHQLSGLCPTCRERNDHKSRLAIPNSDLTRCLSFFRVRVRSFRELLEYFLTSGNYLGFPAIPTKFCSSLEHVNLMENAGTASARARRSPPSSGEG